MSNSPLFVHSVTLQWQCNIQKATEIQNREKYEIKYQSERDTVGRVPSEAKSVDSPGAASKGLSAYQADLT